MESDIKKLALQFAEKTCPNQVVRLQAHGGICFSMEQYEHLIRVVLSEGMMRAADVCKVRCETRGFDVEKHPFIGYSPVEVKAGEASACYDAIRAKADSILREKV